MLILGCRKRSRSTAWRGDIADHHALAEAGCADPAAAGRAFYGGKSRVQIKGPSLGRTGAKTPRGGSIVGGDGHRDGSSRASSTHNPFAWLTAAHLQALATRRNPRKRAEIKFRLIRGLYHCGLSRGQVQQLFRLLDWILALPKDLEYTFKQDLARFEKENNMVYITSVERILREEGRQEGRQEGFEEGLAQSGRAARLAILNQHQQRWGELELGAQANLHPVDDLARLLQLLTALTTADSSEEWKSALASL